MMIRIWCAFFFLLGLMPLLVGATIIQSITRNASVIPRYSKFELNMEVSHTWRNPYDYDQMDLQCIFEAPNGRRDTIPAFYREIYTYVANRQMAKSSRQFVFTVRYAPALSGAWKYTLLWHNRTTLVNGPTGNFTCEDNTNAGFLRTGKSNYLQFENGEQFIPVGENANCPEGNVFADYTKWMDDLAGSKANLMNVWMIPAGFGIEWTSNKDQNFGGLQRYNQANAFHLDWLLEQCVQKNIWISLALNTAGNDNSTVNPGWSNNPYAFQNGGSCNQQIDFFSNAPARKMLKNRLRYIVARYGYSRHIMAWNLFVEVDGIAGYNSAKTRVTAWHKEMSTFLKQEDVNEHLVTTSYANDKENADTWTLPTIDFTQTHYYPKNNNPEKRIANGNKNYVRRYRKPTLTAEFGVDPENIDLKQLDPTGIYLHNVIWSTMFSGGLGTALTYWWNSYIHPQQLYRHFAPLATFVQQLPLAKEEYQPVRASVNTRSTNVVIVPAAGWGAATDTAFTVDQLGNIGPGEDRLPVYLFGTALNQAMRRPLVFKTNYLKQGYLSIEVGDATPAPELWVSIDGKPAKKNVVQANTTYTFAVPAGQHTIEVENTGKDWMRVKSYAFSNAGAALNAYVLKNKKGNGGAGYILNEANNWKNRLERRAIQEETGEVTLYDMVNGAYTIVLYNTNDLSVIGTSKATALNGSLVFKTPAVAKDMAFKVQPQ